MSDLGDEVRRIDPNTGLLAEFEDILETHSSGEGSGDEIGSQPDLDDDYPDNSTAADPKS